MIIFKIIFTNVLLFRHVRVNECVSREVDCILYGMFNVKKKKKEKLQSPLLPTAICFCILSSTV